jgi:nucleoside-diphosphate-sugar epimerase
MEKIAVIGAGGFVGTRLIESLVLDDIHQVTAVVRNYQHMAKLGRFGTKIGLRIADAQNERQLAAALRECSMVVNLVTSRPKAIVRSTMAIYRACIQAKVKRFIHMSSAVVFGQVVSADIDDDAPIISKHWMPYARAKAKSEHFLRKVAPTGSVEVVVLRPGIVWGPRSFWSLNAAITIGNQTAFLVDKGKGICNSIYIDNLVACVVACCDYSDRAVGFYNVSDNDRVTWADFYRPIAEHLGYDICQISKISGRKFKHSLRSVVQDIKYWPLYDSLKEKVSADTRISIKMTLGRLLAPLRLKNGTLAPPKPDITREMWHLQKVQNKLPSVKFKNKFDFIPPVSFEEGARMTQHWLTYLDL